MLMLFLACFGWASGARAEERYYIILFGSQSTPRLPRYTHTWATFVRANVEGTDDRVHHIEEVFTISWMPANMKIRSLRLRPQEGVNLDLYTTLDEVLQNERVSEWGPFQITEWLYELARARKAELDSGVVKYKCVDPNFGPRARYISDCIHGISDLDPENGRLYYWELRRFGEAASHWLAYQLVHRGRRVDLDEPVDWINEGLGLHCYPIVQRPPAERRIWLFDR
jgi:hypothetical protein